MVSQTERALATGIFNGGSNAGAMVAALLVPWCMIHFGDAGGMENGIYHHRRWRFGLADFLVLALQPAQETKAVVQSRVDYIHIDDEAAAEPQTGDPGKFPG